KTGSFAKAAGSAAVALTINPVAGIALGAYYNKSGIVENNLNNEESVVSQSIHEDQIIQNIHNNNHVNNVMLDNLNVIDDPEISQITSYEYSDNVSDHPNVHNEIESSDYYSDPNKTYSNLKVDSVGPDFDNYYIRYIEGDNFVTKNDVRKQLNEKINFIDPQEIDNNANTETKTLKPFILDMVFGKDPNNEQ
uniref:hypothetical protein n=1 Tax=Cysteiniphilum halobium TaxID=2219059 RepID=UPI003F84660D